MLYLAASKLSQLKNFGDKIKCYITGFRVFNYSSGFVNCNMDINIINNSGNDLELKHLTVTLKYKDATGQYKDFMISKRSVQVLMLPAHSTKVLRNLQLSFPVENIITLLSIINNRTNQFMAVVRFEFKGFEVSLDTPIDASSFTKALGDVLQSALNIFKGIGSVTPQQLSKYLV